VVCSAGPAPYRLPGSDSDTGSVIGQRDDGRMVDSIVLMAVVQRHFLRESQPGWGDEQLARDLGLNSEDVARAQSTLDRVARATGHPAVLRARWWVPDAGADAPGVSPPR
jgi:hypothetical protein